MFTVLLVIYNAVQVTQFKLGPFMLLVVQSFDGRPGDALACLCARAHVSHQVPFTIGFDVEESTGVKVWGYCVDAVFWWALIPRPAAPPVPAARRLHLERQSSSGDRSCASASASQFRHVVRSCLILYSKLRAFPLGEISQAT